MNADHKNDTLILGLGNDILGDDGIGSKVVQRLKEDVTLANLKFNTTAVGGLELLEFFSDYSTVILIDAIKTRHGKPGTIYHFTPGDYKETLHLSNFHDVSFLNTLGLAAQLEMSVPARIDILAIEIVEDLNFSNEFSPIISKKYEQIQSEVLALIKNIIES